MRNRIIKVNGNEYSENNSDGEFFIPVSHLNDLRARDLPVSSSLRVIDFGFNDANIDLYFSVINGGREYFSIFLLFSIETDNYVEGSKDIFKVSNVIAGIASDNYLDKPNMRTDKLEDNLTRHSVSYLFDETISGGIILKELAENIIQALNNSKPTIKVFLCHSSQDKPVVEEFAKRLKAANKHVWFDKWEIKIGDSIVEKINEGLETMTHLIIFLSKNSVEKPWVKKELSSALMRKLSDNSVKVMPVKVDTTDIPGIINDIKYADCSEDLEAGFTQLINDIL